MSQFDATILTSIATAVLALGAIVTGVLAYLAFRKQSREVAAIERQVADQKELTAKQADLLSVQSEQLELQRRQFDQEQADRRGAQASRVFTWITKGVDSRFPPEEQASGAHDTLTVHVANTSKQPVYNLVIAWRKGTAARDPEDKRDVLMPDEQIDITRPLPPNLPTTVNRDLFSAVTRFRDSSGVHWLIKPDGQRTEQPPRG